MPSPVAHEIVSQDPGGGPVWRLISQLPATRSHGHLVGISRALMRLNHHVRQGGLGHDRFTRFGNKVRHWGGVIGVESLGSSHWGRVTGVESFGVEVFGLNHWD